MLSKLVVDLYSNLLEVGLWLVLIVGFIAGWRINGYAGGVLGIMGAAVFGAVFFGAFLVLDDIRKTLVSIENKK